MPGLRLAWSWTRNVNTGGPMLYYIANNQIIGSFFSRQEVILQKSTQMICVGR
jgi:hypothetical protein